MKAKMEFSINSPEHYGFGVGIMKQIKVCPHCGVKLENGKREE